MGAIAEAMVAYAQPLLDQTDGSVEQINRAFAIAQFCWNVAILPEKERDGALGEMRSVLNMDAAEFEAFHGAVLLPMIRRHQEMFPRMHLPGSLQPAQTAPGPRTRPTTVVRTEKYPGTARNALCPCGSGKRYKRCCGR